MDFITYLKKIAEDLKSAGKTSDTAKTAERELNKYIAGYTDAEYGTVYARPDPGTLTNVEIDHAAKAETDAWLDNKKSALDIDYDIKSGAESFKKGALEDELKVKESDIEAAAQNARQAARNSSVKQGVARSSIAEGKRDAVENAKEYSLEKTRGAYMSDIGKIDENLRALELKRKSALNDLDYEYAKLLDERVKKLTAERQKREDELVKYENELRKLEREGGASAAADKRSEDIYFKADELLSQMTQKEAREFVKNNERLKASLSSYHYYKLLKKYE